jgi:hypothetical protein
MSQTVRFPEMNSFADVFEAFTTDKASAPEPVTFLREDWAFFGRTTYDKAPRGDGTALITAEYSRILGSHWLALVDASTVPAGV